MNANIIRPAGDKKAAAAGKQKAKRTSSKGNAHIAGGQAEIDAYLARVTELKFTD